MKWGNPVDSGLVSVGRDLWDNRPFNTVADLALFWIFTNLGQLSHVSPWAVCNLHSLSCLGDNLTEEIQRRRHGEQAVPLRCSATGIPASIQFKHDSWGEWRNLCTSAKLSHGLLPTTSPSFCDIKEFNKVWQSYLTSCMYNMYILLNNILIKFLEELTFVVQSFQSYSTEVLSV